MKNAFRRLAILFIANLVVILCNGPTLAKNAGIKGYNIYPFTPAFDNQGILSVDGSKSLPSFRTSFGLFVNYLNDPVYVINPANRRQINIIKSSIMTDLTGAIGFFDFLSVGVNIPAVLYQNGVNYSNLNNYSSSSLGDIGFNLKGTLLKEEKQGIGLGIISKLYLPTGDQNNFSGEGHLSWMGKVALERHFGPVYLAVNAGYRVRNKVRFTSMTIDDTLTFGVGVQYTLPVQKKSWHVFGEFLGESIVNNFEKETTPILFRCGIKKDIGNRASLSLGGDVGITNAVGLPSYGVTGQVSFRFGKEKRTIKEIVHDYITVPFNFDSYYIKSKDRKELKTIAREIVGNNNINVIRVSGHTDSVGHEEYNQILSKKRAISVTKELIKNGVSPDQIVTEGLGETKPKASNRSEAGRQINRRTEVVGEERK